MYLRMGKRGSDEDFPFYFCISNNMKKQTVNELILQEDISEDLWIILRKYTNQRKLDNSVSILSAASILVKTGIQLYTIVLADKDIISMLKKEIIDSIPFLRTTMEDKIEDKSVH